MTDPKSVQTSNKPDEYDIPQLNTYKKRRSSHKGKVTVFKNYLESLLKSKKPLSDLDIIQLSNRLESYKSLANEFDKNQTLIDDIVGVSDEQLREREQFEIEYQYQLALGIHLLRENETACVAGSVPTPTAGDTATKAFIKLPTIDLPHFSGECQNWLEYRDTFESLIHNNKSIDDIQKFHYLRASLQGEASDIIKSLEMSSHNYRVAWELITERYNNTHQLIYNHLHALFSIQNIEKESATSLRQLLDTVNKNLRALNNLGEPTVDTILIYLITSKLDFTTLRYWKESSKNNTVEKPTLQDLKSYLSDRFMLLQNLEDTKNIHENIQQTDSKSHTSKSDNKDKQSRIPCPLCKGQHFLFACPQFKQMTVEKRIEKVSKFSNFCANCLHNGHETKSCRGGACKYCQKKHNTMLHIHKEPTKDTAHTTLASNSSSQHTSVLLSTALVHVIANDGTPHLARVLLDSGSTSCYITNSLSTKLNLTLEPIRGTVSGINQQHTKIFHRTNVLIKSLHGSFTVNLSCLVLDTIAHSLPHMRINTQGLNIPKHLKLADPQFYEPAPIDILLGADIFWQIISSGHIRLGKQQPTLQETELGWLVSGCTTNTDKHTNSCFFNNNNSDQLSRFWELDSLSNSQINDPSESDACEIIFTQTTTRQSDGRFVVNIPFKKSPDCLGDSYYQAKKRFYSIENRMNSNHTYKQQYSNFITEYIQLGHMTLNKHLHKNTHIHSEHNTSIIHSSANSTNTNIQHSPVYYLPHHGIIRESSTTTKFRAVFDGSAKTSSKLALNDIQLVGPVVQDDLISILIRFRQHKYIISADIEKMFRQITVAEHQRPLQQIIWRYNPTEPLQTYTLNTVTYGTASAPFLATRCIKQIGLDCQNTQNHSDSYDHKLVSEIILHDFYCDDLLTGIDDESVLLEIAKGVFSELQKYQFPLRKWQSNCPAVLNKLGFNDSDSTTFNLSSNDPSKTLGIYWNINKDTISYTVHSEFVSQKQITKRTILSTIGHIFDPLGLISPCVLEAKLIMQQMWINNISWDGEIPVSIQQQWARFVESLSFINHLSIPRRAFHDSSRDNIELHIFCDASQQAYGACAYIRTYTPGGNINVQLLVAKGRVAPLKTLTIPRLELCAAFTGVNLSNKVLNSLRNKNNCKCYYWSDSIIVLSWINSPTHKLQTFVKHKVTDILKHTEPQSWYYVPTKQNPADIITKCTNAQQLLHTPLWFSGPDFLRNDDNHSWPEQPGHLSVSDLPEVRSQTHLTHKHTIDNNSFIYKYSNFNKLTRIVAYILRFIHHCKHKQSNNINTKTCQQVCIGDVMPLSTSELNSARYQLAKIVQLDFFFEEYQLLLHNKQLPASHRLNSLNPFIEDNHLIRVGGRLAQSPFNYDRKFPILLHPAHHITQIIFSTYHITLLHAGPQLLLSHIRQAFWPISGRNLARKTTQSCVTCKRFKGKIITPIMGQLPEQRLHANFVFSDVGVDYAGPIMINNRKGRGSVLIKSYICIFICFVVKAVHLELVTDLTTESYIAAINRFISRRGKPNNIYSDNGRNLVGAARVITNFIGNHSESIYSCAAEQGVNFHFIPPYSPHFGGLWESTVKSVKHHLKRVLGMANLTYEEMYTLLVQIEGILNSRPLTPLSSDPSDLSALTPFHFLIGRTLTVLPHPQMSDCDSARLPRHQRVELLRQHFWRRFNKEYISQLHQRTRWQRTQGALTEGSLVIVKDEALPVAQWPLGRIVKLYPGHDGEARVADIKIKTGTIRRAFHKICPLLDGPSD